MTIVVVFSLFGDDIRVWATPKAADPYFYAGFLMSFVMFTVEILIKTVVDEEHKYSFFFWLDIIATLSLILDIPWFTDPLATYLFDSVESSRSVDAIPGQPLTEEAIALDLTQLVKSMRLIRLIRILKIYKYISGDARPQEDQGGKKKKKKKVVPEKKEDEEEKKEESIFVQETDPTKLGKAMIDTLTRNTIVGILTMLIVLPMLSPVQQDYSG